MAERENKLLAVLYEDTINALLELPNESMARVMKAILYSVKGQEPSELDVLESVIFKLLYGQVERAGSLSQKRAEAGASKRKSGNQNGVSPNQPETDIEQNQSNSIKTNQTQSNDIKQESKLNTITSTITETNTKTLTNTEDISPIPPAGDDVGVPAEPEKSKQGVRTSSDVVRQRFGRFWAAYPKKQGKGAAEKAFCKIKPSEQLLIQMLEALERAKKCSQWNRDGGQYIPNPATWLNQKRWEDDYREVMEAEIQPPNYGSFLPDW